MIEVTIVLPEGRLVVDCRQVLQAGKVGDIEGVVMVDREDVLNYSWTPRVKAGIFQGRRGAKKGDAGTDEGDEGDVLEQRLFKLPQLKRE